MGGTRFPGSGTRFGGGDASQGCRVRDDAFFSDGGVNYSASQVLQKREAALLALWRRRQRTALADHILESATELCAARKAWAKGGGAEELRPILEANARRTEIEYGPTSEDAAQARAVLEVFG